MEFSLVLLPPATFFGKLIKALVTSVNCTNKRLSSNPTIASSMKIKVDSPRLHHRSSVTVAGEGALLCAAGHCFGCLVVVESSQALNIIMSDEAIFYHRISKVSCFLTFSLQFHCTQHTQLQLLPVVVPPSTILTHFVKKIYIRSMVLMFF